MGLKKRIGVIVESQFDDWVTRAEDPAKILNQAVEEMEEGIETAKSKMALLRYRVEEENKLLSNLCGQIEYWQGRAEDFVCKGMDRNAREAVRKRRVLEEEQRRVGVNIAEDKIIFDEYEECYNDLDKRIRACKSKRSLIFKALAIRSGPPGVKDRGPIDGGGRADEPFSVFKKMEVRLDGEREFSAASGEKKAASLENENKLIDEELENIKKNLSKGGSKK